MEQVFLIHRKTGLLLQHVVGGTGAVQDADMVASMLTAIRDFVQNSFGGQREEVLDNFQVGELTVMVEQGPQALLAALIRGTAPKDLRVVFQETIEQIHVEHTQALDELDGEAAPLRKPGSALKIAYVLKPEPLQYSKKRKRFPHCSLLWESSLHCCLSG